MNILEIEDLGMKLRNSSFDQIYERTATWADLKTGAVIGWFNNGTLIISEIKACLGGLTSRIVVADEIRVRNYHRLLERSYTSTQNQERCLEKEFLDRQASFNEVDPMVGIWLIGCFFIPRLDFAQPKKIKITRTMMLESIKARL